MPYGSATAEDLRALPPTCRVVRWVVFGPGFHRGNLYSPEMCQRVCENFQRLRNYIRPVVKIGHDKNQKLTKRLKESLGFLNLGDFEAVTPEAGGCFSVTLVNVPTTVGAQINAGRIRSGSVELIPHIDDPADLSKKIEGPIITGVSFLGEEAPAVKGFAPPRAVFADGTPVPPDHDPTPWLEAMAEVMSEGFSDAYDPAPQTYTISGRTYPLYAVCFSEMKPMIDASFLQSLGLTPEQIDQIMAQQGGAAPGAEEGAPPALGAGGPPPAGDMGGGGMAGGMPTAAATPGPVETPTPDKTKLSQDDQTMMSDLTKRMSALEKFAEGESKKAQAACMAAFSDRVDQFLNEERILRRVSPRTRPMIRKMGMEALTKKEFADTPYPNTDKAFAAWKDSVEAMPESVNMSEHVTDGAPQKKPGRRVLTEGQRKIVASNTMQVRNPTFVKKILTPPEHN